MEGIAIMGLGLMGGSLGLALKARGFEGRIAGYARRKETRALALRRGAVDEAFEDPGAAVARAGLVVLCVPILAIPGLAKACAGKLKPGTVVTDVGSTKERLSGLVRSALAGTNAVYVGSHPIAGSEQQGLEAARADLYEGAVVIVTDDGAGERSAVDAVQSFWQGLGGLVRVMPANEHDRTMARTSHLPHVVSSLLAAAVGREELSEDVGRFCGPGFRDTTRTAEGSPAVWRDIVESNGAALAAELDALAVELEAFRRAVREGDFDRVQEMLERGRASRRALMRNGTGDGPRGA